MRGFLDLVKDSWSLPVTGSSPNCSPISFLLKKLRRLKAELKGWNRRVFGDVHERIRDAYARVELVQKSMADLGRTEALVREEYLARRCYSEMVERQCCFLRQKNRASWLKDGDRNTKFFHTSLRIRSVSAGISRLEIDGAISEDRGVISDHLVNYYVDLFAFSPSISNVDLFDQVMGAEVSAEQNEMLARIPCDEEIKTAVFSLSIESAPGPDGFGGGFFQSCWDTVKGDLIGAVRDFFTTGILPRGLNSSFATLIPKSSNAMKVEDYRPIVLGNFVYKIMAKILASRLGVVLAAVISPNQFGFIPGRQIHDCIAIASEGINSLDNLAKVKNMAIKVDIRKAFDTLSWAFLLQILRSWGFGDQFVGWIESILLSGHLSILVNGLPKGHFPCRRGVRQGDPLSPLLFCVAEEFLSRRLSLAKAEGRLDGFHIGYGVDFPSHLLYADDVIIFAKATRRSCRTIVGILQEYAGFLVRSSILRNREFTSAHTSLRVIKRILGVCWGFRLRSFLLFILGFLFSRGVLSRDTYVGLLTLFWPSLRDGKVSNFPWRAGFVWSSRSSRGVFVHSMMVYSWPRSLLQRMDTCIRNFIWTGDVSSTGNCTVGWDRCCRPKNEGGLGVRSLLVMNDAFNANLTWKILTSSGQFMRIIRDRLIGKDRIRNMLNSSIRTGIKRNWRVMRDGAVILASAGGSTKFWLDNWLGFVIADRLGIPDALRHLYQQSISDYYVNGMWQFTEEFCFRHYGIVVALASMFFVQMMIVLRRFGLTLRKGRFRPRFYTIICDRTRHGLLGVVGFGRRLLLLLVLLSFGELFWVGFLLGTSLLLVAGSVPRFVRFVWRLGIRWIISLLIATWLGISGLVFVISFRLPPG